MLCGGMRRVLIGLALLASACGEMRSRAPDHAATPAPDALAFTAASETARSFTGDLIVERGALSFSKGARLTTHTVAARGSNELIARGGESFATVALSSGGLQVETRAITAQRLLQGAPSLCPGDWPPSYAALVYGRRDARVTLILFQGVDEPGPDARDSRVCATYAYNAPAGARTGQGVVL
jgi:hypothetical protein